MSEIADRLSELRERERCARARLGASARGLRDALAGGAERARREHPWTLPIAGFAAGLLIPFLLPPRQARRRQSVRAEGSSRLHDAWGDARTAAAETLAQALAAAIRRLLDARPPTPAPENPNGCTR